MRTREVRVVPPGTCACKMIAGDARRVAQASYLVGYYMACPECGQVNVVLADEQPFAEEKVFLSMGLGGLGHRCSRCSIHFRLNRNRFEVDRELRAGA